MIDTTLDVVLAVFALAIVAGAVYLAVRSRAKKTSVAPDYEKQGLSAPDKRDDAGGGKRPRHVKE